MSDADNGQRLGAILARLRAVAASTSAQSGRHPAGGLTASAAQPDTQSASHAVAGCVQALAQYSRQPANRPEGLAGTVQPPVALEVAARVAALRQILTSDCRIDVGECLVGRHASGRAVKRCACVGVRHVGSVGLSVFRHHRLGGRSSFT
eukprot:scaffold6823_cov149-Isochrysis_galbana.AAC.1